VVFETTTPRPSRRSSSPTSVRFQTWGATLIFACSTGEVVSLSSASRKVVPILKQNRNLYDLIKIYGNERRAIESDTSLDCVNKMFDDGVSL